MAYCSKCNKKFGLLEEKYKFNNQIVCQNCNEKMIREQEQLEEKRRREAEEAIKKEKEEYHKKSVEDLIRLLGSANEREKRLAMGELATREDSDAINSLWEALNLEGGFDYDWRWEIYIKNIPIIGKLGNEETLKESIKMQSLVKKNFEEANITLGNINNAIEDYHNNPNPAPEATEAYNDCIQNLDFVNDIIEKSTITLDTLGDAINNLKKKKFEKIAVRIETNIDSMSWQEFEDAILDALDAERNSSRVGDMGIDGFCRDGTPIQIKQSNNIGRNVVDNFETALRRYFPNEEPNKRGIIVALSFTKGAYNELIRAKDEDKIDIQLITADELDIQPKK